MLKSRQLMHKADWNIWDIAGNQFPYSRSALPAVNSILQPAPNAMCERTIRKPYAGTAWRTENSTEIRDYSVRTNLNCVRLFGSNLWSRIPFYKQQLCTWIQTMLLTTDMLNMCHQYREIYQRNFTQNSRYLSLSHFLSSVIPLFQRTIQHIIQEIFLKSFTIL